MYVQLKCLLQCKGCCLYASVMGEVASRIRENSVLAVEEEEVVDDCHSPA